MNSVDWWSSIGTFQPAFQAQSPKRFFFVCVDAHCKCECSALWVLGCNMIITMICVSFVYLLGYTGKQTEKTRTAKNRNKKQKKKRSREFMGDKAERTSSSVVSVELFRRQLRPFGLNSYQMALTEKLCRVRRQKVYKD